MSENVELPDADLASSTAMSQDPDDCGFAERLRILMGTEKPYRFAARCDISRSTMKTFLERGAIMTGKNLIRIRKATGVSLDWLLAGDEPMYTSVTQGSVVRTADAPPAYLSPRAASAPPWLEPVWAAYKRLVKPVHVRWARNSVLAYQALATEFPHLSLSNTEAENVMAMLNKLTDDLPEEVPVSLTMVQTWLWQLEEQGTRLNKKAAAESDK